MSEQFLEQLSKSIRRDVLKMTHNAKSSHIGSNYSMIELLVVLYTKILHINSAMPSWPERDRFILSKGHGCAALYAILADRSFFPSNWLDTFYQDGSNLAGHITHVNVPGIEMSTGSLGHGLSVATGMALAAKRDEKSYRIFCMLSDGECDEGSVWEPALFAPHHHLDNLIVIIDYNKIQSLGTVKEVIDLEPLADKWRSFGWSVQEIDGHNLKEIEEALTQIPNQKNSPTCIIAHTIKGKGVSFMEDRLLWHYRTPQGQEYESALAELGCAL